MKIVLSLHTTLPVVLALGIAIVAVTVMLLQWSNTSSNIQSFSEGHAKAFSETATVASETLFEKVVPDITVFADQVRMEYPVMDLLTVDNSPFNTNRWENLLNYMIRRHTSRKDLVVWVALVDGTIMRSRVFDDENVLTTYIYVPGSPSTTILRYRNETAHTEIAGAYPYVNVNANDIPKVGELFALFSATDSTDVAPRWTGFEVVRYPNAMTYSITAPLRRNSGELIGIVQVNLKIEALDRALQEVSNVSPDITAFVIKLNRSAPAAEAEVVGQSGNDPRISHRNRTDPIPPNCQAPWGIDDTTTMVCRPHATEFAPLNRFLDKLLHPTFGEAFQLEGEDSYVVLQIITSSLDDQTFSFILATCYSAKDVVKDVNRTRLIETIIGASVAIASALLLGLWTRYSLRALPQLSKSISQSSTLRTVKTTTKKSVISELRAVQDAYDKMTEELKALRAYVPLSIRVTHPIGATDSECGHTPTHTSTTIEEAIMLPVKPEQLMEPVNQFNEREVSTVTLFTDVSTNPSDLGAASEKICSIFFKAVMRHYGVIDQQGPQFATATFNAHSKCPSHRTAAITCAKEASRYLITQGIHNYVVVECALQCVGPCGWGPTISHVVVGETLAVPLANLMKTYLPSRVLVTENAAKGTNASLVPIDSIIPELSKIGTKERIFVYEPLPREWSDEFAQKMTEIFKALAEGDHANAKVRIDKISAEPLPDDAKEHIRRWSENCAHVAKGGTFARKELPGWEAIGNSVAPLEPQLHSPYSLDVVASNEESEHQSSYALNGKSEDVSIPLWITDSEGTRWARSTEHVERDATYVVYRVMNLSGQRALLKVIQSPYAASIHQQMKVLVPLKHNNVAAYFGTAELENSVALIFEDYCGSVRWYMRRFGEFSYESLLRTARDTLRGLEYLHLHGVVHGELRPESVVFTRDNAIKLTGYGFTERKLWRHKDAAKYMAPEVLSGENPTPQADVWSFAMTILGMLDLDAPYDPNNPLQPPKLPSPGDHPCMTDTLEAQLCGCLQVDPARRTTIPQLLANFAVMGPNAADEEPQMDD